MKKTMMMGMVLAGTLGAFASVDNVAITFSTPGSDTYRDGRTVLDGECYALVWTPAGATFGGIAADGAAVSPSKVGSPPQSMALSSWSLSRFQPSIRKAILAVSPSITVCSAEMVTPLTVEMML